MNRESTGGRLLADHLARHGVETIFLIPGVQLDYAVDGLKQHGDKFRLIVPRHEQTTTYMADGFYRASGKPGVAMVVPGPGVLNAGAGLATAYASNSKVLFVAGNIHSKGIGAGFGMLHEIKDQSGLIAGLTKWHRRVDDAREIGQALDEAFHALQSGRPRPVGLEVAHDLLAARVDTNSISARGELPDSKIVPGARSIEQAAQHINTARFPILYVGGGVLAADASESLRRLAERIGAAVIMSDNARGALSDRHPLAMNSLAGRALLEHADLAVVIGSRFMDALSPTPSWTAPIRTIHINIDAADFAPPRAPLVAVHGDAHAALEALHDHLTARTVLSAADAVRLKQWAQQQIDAVSPQSEYIRAIRAALPEDGIFVNELTQVGYLARIAFPVFAPRTYIGPGYQGTLGYGFPCGLGAAVGAPGRRVLAVTGDGGFGWNLQELATARKYDLPVTLVVFNDGHFGNVRAIQKRDFGFEAGVDLRNPDFVLLAQAFGVPGVRAESPAALESAIRSSLAERGPVLIDAPVGVMPSPWHLLRLTPMMGYKGPPAPPNPLRG
jgi:acetolactate synthase-1/2/3 large subunit